jgi:hypothetical protein
VFTGTRYCGKTDVLKSVESQLRTAGPYAYLDLAHRHLPTLVAMLDELVPQLRQGSAEYGRLRFTRYIIARLVMTRNYPVANINQRNAATGAIAELLVREWHPAELRRFVQPAAAQVAVRYDIPAELANAAAGIAFDAVTRRFPGRKWVLRKPGVSWFQEQDPRHRRPEDVLTDLYLASREDADDDGAAATDRLLMSAFLEDLRSDLKRGSWMNNATILLDNADGPTWYAFRDRFVEHRHADDPVAVIAAGRGHRETAVPTAVGPELAEVAEVACLKVDTTTGPPADREVRMPDLGVGDIAEMVTAGNLCDPNDTRVANEVAKTLHELTRGHAGATRFLLTAMRPPADGVDPRALLDRRLPDDRHGTVADELCDLLARDHETGARRGDANGAALIIEDLATCSAARDLLWAGKLITAGRRDDGRPFMRLATDDDVFRRELWTGGAVPSRPVLLPVLRRLLLLRLAARPAGSPYGWDVVQRVLRDLAAQERDDEGELYHALALGEIGRVADHLWALFAAGDVAGWLSRMGAVLVAPNRLDLSGPLGVLAGDLGSGVAAAGEGADGMAGIVAAQWLMSDPLTSGRREHLRTQAGKAYGALWDAAPVRLQAVLPGTWPDVWRRARRAAAPARPE